MPTVRVRAVSKRFGCTRAIDAVDLDIAPGEVRGLLGPNGAGKTTLLRMLFGLIRPDGGVIEVLGRSVPGPGPVALEGVAGFVEDPAFYPYLSGRANLELLAELDRDAAGPRGRAACGRAIDDVLARVDLKHRAGDRVSTYSTGMRQRLGLAGALLRSPRLLLLDEPTSGLDPAGARAVADLVRGLAAGGAAVLLSSHLIGELETVCDSFTVLRHGRVVWEGTVAALRAQAPASAYLISTSDDVQAVAIAAAASAVQAWRRRDGSLAITAHAGCLDEYVIALGQARVAIRRLELMVSPLESMFFALTSDEPTEEMEPIELAERALAVS